MPKTTNEILAHADELAKQFEGYDFDPADRENVSPETRLRLAALKRADVEKELTEAVTEARAKGLSWAKVGVALGTSGQSANERYSTQTEAVSAAAASSSGPSVSSRRTSGKTSRSRSATAGRTEGKKAAARSESRAKRNA